jgi:hypothetical protein
MTCQWSVDIQSASEIVTLYESKTGLQIMVTEDVVVVCTVRTDILSSPHTVVLFSVYANSSLVFVAGDGEADDVKFLPRLQFVLDIQMSVIPRRWPQGVFINIAS